MSNNIPADQLGLVTKADATSVSPERIAREAAQLGSLVADLNKKAGGQPPFEIPSHKPIAPFVPSKVEVLTPPKPAPVEHSRSPFDPRLLFYTGRLKAGKDFVAAATGATIFGFAEPLYAMRRTFFGEVDKDKHGARELLQLFGQWGRGVVSAQYPLNASRASFTMLARTMGARGDFGDWSVDWASFGRNENIWLDGMTRRVTQFREQRGNEDKRVACVNVRFANEHRALTESGWTHFHVMCSTDTWNARIRAAGLEPGALAMTDVSEQMAINLDRQALQAAQKAPTRKLRCIWNDEKHVSGTPGAFHTVQSFLGDLEIFS